MKLRRTKKLPFLGHFVGGRIRTTVITTTLLTHYYFQIQLQV